MKPNGIPASETLSSFIAGERITSLEITPLRNEADTPEDGTAYVMCDPDVATMWSVYGRKADGMAILLHDLSDEPGPEVQWLHDKTGLEVSMFAKNSCSGSKPTTMDLAEWLTEVIHDDLPDVAAEDFREDDFDNHPLAALRESLCWACGYDGGPVRHPEAAG